MKRVIFLSVLASFVCLLSYDGTAFPLLRQSSGMKSSALNSGSVVCDGVWSGLNNPAIFSQNDGVELGFQHQQIFEGVNLTGLGFLTRNKKIQISISAFTLDVNDLEYRTYPTLQPEGEFSNREILINSNAGYKFTEKISAGLSLKLLHEKIEKHEATGWVWSPGIFYQFSSQMNMGLSGDMVLNEGRIKNEKMGISNSFKYGFSYQFEIPGTVMLKHILLTLEGFSPEDGFHLHSGIAANFGWLELQSGFSSGYDSRDFSAGAEICFRKISIQYVFLPWGNGLGQSNKFGISVII